MDSRQLVYRVKETAYNCTLNDVYQSKDYHQATVLVSLDLSAVFNTINHSSLLSRLFPAQLCIGRILTFQVPIRLFVSAAFLL
jgi:hypothetical protein